MAPCRLRNSEYFVDGGVPQVINTDDDNDAAPRAKAGTKERDKFKIR